MESKLKYPGEVYQPTWRFLRENFTEAEMRREYSRLRDIAQKRLGRMGESEFARSATYERNVGQFPKLSAYSEKGRIVRKAEFSRRFAQLPPGVVADMREFCGSVGMPVSSFIRRAIREYLISLKLDDLGRYKQ